MITNDEVNGILQCIASKNIGCPDIDRCPHGNNRGLCMIILTSITTYKQWWFDCILKEDEC